MKDDIRTPAEDSTEKCSPPPSDPNLSQLRAQIKKVMIPLLIRIFELKLAVQQAKTPPSRLQVKPNEPKEEIVAQLERLQEDIHLLQLWCLSCQKQIERALNEAAPSATFPKYTQKKPEAPTSQEDSSNWLSRFLKK